MDSIKHICITLIVAGATGLMSHAQPSDALSGAWRTQQGDIQQTAVFVDGYLSHSVFDVTNKKFISTRGGTYKADNGKLTVTWHYDTEQAANEQYDATWVGTSSNFTIHPETKQNT